MIFTKKKKKNGCNDLCDIYSCCFNTIYFLDFEKKENYIPVKKSSNNYRHTPVLQYDKNMNLLHKYSSIREAEEILRISNIGRACIQTYRTAGGFKWRYADDHT